MAAHHRKGRFMAVFGAFVDDSGSHAQSAMMVLTGLVAKHEDWQRFSEEWYAALISGKSLTPVRGHIYFKSTEAARCSGCFAGFSREEADEKTDLLTDIALKHICYGVVAAIKWEHFNEVVQGQIIRSKGRLIKFAQHPFDLCFHALTGAILGEQVRRENHEEIDFAFDQQGSLLLRCINWYNEYKKKAPEPLREIMGQVIPGDDKTLLPIQAADLVAWQVRNRSLGAPVTGSVGKIADSQKLLKRPISKPELENFITGLNTATELRSMLRALGIDLTPEQVVEMFGAELLGHGAPAASAKDDDDGKAENPD